MTDSKLVLWMRKKLKVDKPYALDMGEWEMWEQEFKQRRPVAFFLTETIPDTLDDCISFFTTPLLDLKYYCRNRWVTKTHLLKTGLPKGKWYDFDDRLLHGAFNELVNFVEIEKAHLLVLWSREERPKYNVPWWSLNKWTRWPSWRCADAGISYLTWEAQLTMGSDNPTISNADDPTSQALAAQECLALYSWWKEVRPAREDPYDQSGYNAFYQYLKDRYSNVWFETVMTTEERVRFHELSLAVEELEEQHNAEDEAYLLRLVKLRRSLWT